MFSFFKTSIATKNAAKVGQASGLPLSATTFGTGGTPVLLCGFWRAQLFKRRYATRPAFEIAARGLKPTATFMGSLRDLRRTLRVAVALVTALLTLAFSSLYAADEQKLIAIIQSPTASVPDKCSACQHLRLYGTAKAVPAIAPLLEQERTAQVARYALEGLPFPEAVTALREALPKTSGLVKAGIIDSLGWRHDAKAVPLLTKALSDTNTAVASSAATALGRIGGKQAVNALLAARGTASADALRAVFDGLLRNAALVRAAGYPPGFGDECPEPILVAAWRDLVLTDYHFRTNALILELSNSGRILHKPALQVLRELKDESVVKAALAKWPELPADAQLAVLDARVKLGGSDVLDTVNRASQSDHPSVRTAAYSAFGDLGDPKSISTLAKSAAVSTGAERDAARDALARIHGDGVEQAVLKQVAIAEPPERVELLRALGDRGDSDAAKVFLQNAFDQSEPVRLAALEGLRKVAAPSTAVPLLDLAAHSKSQAECDAALAALRTVCQAAQDKEQTGRIILGPMAKLQPSERARVLPVLIELPTPSVLEAVQAATRDQNSDLAKEGMRVLAQWPNAAPASYLLSMAQTTQTPSLQVLALRGCISVAGLEADTAKRLDLLLQAIAASKRPEEKKQALAQLAHIPTPEALKKVMDYLSEPDLANEAGLAALTIAEPISKTNPDLAKETASQVLARCNTPEITRRAWAIRGKPGGQGPFLIDWVVSGPYNQPGVTGAMAIFDIAFPPEKPGAAVQWKPFPRGKTADLLSFFPDHANCAAYLKTKIESPKDCDAALLVGSDDGVKAWLNGAVVHANNVDRGLTADEDIAPIHLKEGANALMLKITQGGGGWAACARIVGIDGKPIKGLKAKAEP